jgi:hypothetical protein
VKRRGTTLGLFVFGLLAGLSSIIPALDRFVTALLLAVLAFTGLGGLGWLVWGPISEWWALVNPDPKPPALRPRYWPGSPLDRGQAAEVEGPK